MPNENLVLLIGHLGDDTQMTYTQSGTAIANMSLATSWGKKTATGEWENYTDWHKVVAFGKTAERAQIGKKGDAVQVVGKIRYESWDDKETGAKRYATKIIADRINILTKSAGGGEEPTVDEDETAKVVEVDELPF